MKTASKHKSSSRVMSWGSVTACLLVLVVLAGTPASARLFSFSDFKGKRAERQLVRHQDSIEHTPAQEAFDELEEVRRMVIVGQTVAV